MSLTRVFLVLLAAMLLGAWYLDTLDRPEVKPFHRVLVLVGLAKDEPTLWRPPSDDPWRAYLAPDSSCPAAGDARRSPAEQTRTMACLIDYARAKKGLAAVRKDERLDRAAALKSQLVVSCGQFSHTPCGTPFRKVFLQAGYGSGSNFASVGENLAYGEDEEGSPLATFDNWLNSPEHRQNLFTAKWRVYGLDVAQLPHFLDYSHIELWVSEFGVSG